MLIENWSNEIIMDPFYPCLKYKKSADPKLDGTDYFIVAESMHLKDIKKEYNTPKYEVFNCSLSFTCENDKKAFFNLIQDCLHFLFEEGFQIFHQQSFFSLIIYFNQLK